MPRRGSISDRILRLYRTFSALDAGAVACAVGIPPQEANVLLCYLARQGRLKRRARRSERRPLRRVEYHREVE